MIPQPLVYNSPWLQLPLVCQWCHILCHSYSYDCDICSVCVSWHPEDKAKWQNSMNETFMYFILKMGTEGVVQAGCQGAKPPVGVRKQLPRTRTIFNFSEALIKVISLFCWTHHLVSTIDLRIKHYTLCARLCASPNKRMRILKGTHFQGHFKRAA